MLRLLRYIPAAVAIIGTIRAAKNGGKRGGRRGTPRRSTFRR